MNELKLKSIKVKNYRSFGKEQVFEFPKKYDKLTKDFFATVQNKMHFAVHGKTAAELILI